MSSIRSFFKLLHGNYLYYRFKHLYEKEPKLAAYGLYDRIYGNHDDFNIDEPKSLIEKITWMELYADTSMWTLCADKYRMREYVEQCGLGEYLPKNYGHWKNPDDIDFDTLPNEFVLKANNGCGTVMIVKDKSKINRKIVKITLKQWLKHKYGYMGAHAHYLTINPCIIAEELLHQDEEQMSFSPESIVDYKVWCINGVPESVLVVYGRDNVSYGLDLYDTEWNRLDDKLKLNGHFKFTKEKIPRPTCLKDMIEMAKVLSEPFPQVRVDLYVIGNRPVIGEMTFGTGYGYFTNEYYNYLGEKINLNNLKIK